jgi:hypothetical protein
MRDVALGTLLFVLLLAAALPSVFASRAEIAAPSPSPSRAVLASGPGFVLCGADESWHRPTDAEQQAHLAGDHRYDGSWGSPGTTGYREFRAPAVLYDGKSASGLGWIMQFTGLWNVWDAPQTRPKTCWSEQPQVFLFGYEAVTYDAQDPNAAVLHVRAAPGYRMLLLTGPVRPRISIFDGRKLDELIVPTAWVTPVH